MARLAPKSFSLDEVAEATELKVRWIEEWCRAGTVEAIHAKGQWRMTEAQVDKMLARLTRKAVAPMTTIPVPAEPGAVDIEGWKANKRASLARRTG